MAWTLGFNNGYEFEGYTRINISMTESSNLEDIKQVIDENYDGVYDIDYTDGFHDTVSIRVKSISEEEFNAIEEKLNEKYQFPEGETHVVPAEMPAYNIFDLVKGYIMPIIISLLIVLIYFAIAFRKLGLVKAILEPIITIIMVILVYASIFAISRLPITAYVVPLGMVIYIITLMCITIQLNNEKKFS